jgi:hypothetical protein
MKESIGRVCKLCLHLQCSALEDPEEAEGHRSRVKGGKHGGVGGSSYQIKTTSRPS